MKDLHKRLLVYTGDYCYNIITYYYLHLKHGFVPPWPDFKNPKRFNEKIIHLKVYCQQPDAHLYTDKYLVRDFISNVIGPEYLIPLIGVYSDTSEINFLTLPDKFILKANHGSGWNIACKDKKLLNHTKVVKTLNRWLKTNYYDIGRDYSYKNIQPKIIAETLIETKDGSDLMDYKLFCFNGEPLFIQVDIDRSKNHKRAFFDIHWNRKPFTTLYPIFTGNIDPPDFLEEMILIAKKISKGFPFLRVDLYEANGKVFFGEMTFHHGGGFEPFMPSEYDTILGNYLKLPGR